MGFFHIFLRYRLPEILQVFGICVSWLFFRPEDLDALALGLWALAMLSAIASAFWINDYFDFEDDRSNFRKAHAVSKHAVLVPGLLSLLLSLGLAPLVSVSLLRTVALVALASFLYSAPIFRLKSRIFAPVIVHFFMGVVFFQSASALTGLSWTGEEVLMAIFWGIILGTGSLGNELVDQAVDERTRIKTVANTYPGLIRKIILGFLGLAFLVFVLLMVIEGLAATLILSTIVAAVYGMQYLNKSSGWSQEDYRRHYRVAAVMIILSFHLELVLRN